nr:noggin 2 [Hymenolepis microstoma]
MHFTLIVLFCLFSSLSSIPQYQYSRDINRTLSEETWRFFLNRNQQKLATSPYDDALLLDIQKPLPPDAFLSPRKMFILLGPRFFNPDLQSVSIPREAYLYPDGQLNFPNKTRASTKLTRKRISTLRKYLNRLFKREDIQALSTYATCPVIYAWKDYGEQYWPRWVREGSCIDLEGTSCSLPPGMFCVGHEERTVVMLRYLCPLSGNEDSCNWYRMQKPVLISCKCACR